MNLNITTKSASAKGLVPRRGRWTPAPCSDDCEGHMPRVGRGLDDGSHDTDTDTDTEGHMPRIGSRVAAAGASTALAAVGLVAFGSVSHAAGEEWWYDDTGDGVYDTVRVDRWGDGVADVEAYDWNQNNVFELIKVDTDNDGLIDVYGVDTTENGYLDRVDLDFNEDGWADQVIYDSDEDGINDAVEVSQSMTTGTPGVAIISSPTNPDGFYNLMMTMAAVTGQATFGTGDADHDGWNDNLDYSPYDPMYH